MTSILTPRERELARHALGLDGRRKRSFENSCHVWHGSADFASWVLMAERRLAWKYGTIDDYSIFRLTRAGALAALDEGESLDSEEFPE